MSNMSYCRFENTMDYEPLEPPTTEDIAAQQERREQERQEKWEIKCAAKLSPVREWENEIMLWTTAAPSYDGFGTVETGRQTTWRGREYREVRVLEKYHDWQKSRYLSGCHDCLTTAEFEMLANAAKPGVAQDASRLRT